MSKRNESINKVSMLALGTVAVVAIAVIVMVSQSSKVTSEVNRLTKVNEELKIELDVTKDLLKSETKKADHYYGEMRHCQLMGLSSIDTPEE